MSEKIHKLFSPDGHIPEEMLLRYVGKQLNPADEHRVERHALHCELCSDTLEGLMYAKHPDKLPEIIATINKEIQQRSAPKVKVVRMNTRTVLSMAAGLALVLSVGYIILQQGGGDMSAPNTSEQLKLDKEEITLPKASDSSKNTITSNEPNKQTPKDDPENLNRKILADAPVEEEVNGVDALSSVNQEGDGVASPPPVQADDYKVVTGGKEQPLSPKGPPSKDLKKSEKDEEGDMDIISLEEKQKEDIVTKTEKKPTDKVIKGENRKKSKSRANAYEEPKKVVTTHPDPSPNIVTYDQNNQNINTIVTTPNNVSTSSPETTTSGYTLQSKSDSSVSVNEINFSTGTVYFEKNSFDTAIVHLEKVTNVPPYSKYEEAQWKLAQSYLKKNKKEKAKVILEELNKGDGKYKAPAAEKLKELK